MPKQATARRQCPPAIDSTELIRKPEVLSAICVSLFPSYRAHTEALESSAQIRSVSPSCWRYRVATKSASKAARIPQMLRRIVRNLGAGLWELLLTRVVRRVVAYLPEPWQLNVVIAAEQPLASRV
jgi:hypothetical protein